jgi:hypothetical protein
MADRFNGGGNQSTQKKTTPFCLYFNFNSIYYLKLHDSSSFCQKIIECLKSYSEMSAYGISPALKIATSSPRTSISL